MIRWPGWLKRRPKLHVKWHLGDRFPRRPASPLSAPLNWQFDANAICNAPYASALQATHCGCTSLAPIDWSVSGYVGLSRIFCCVYVWKLQVDPSTTEWYSYAYVSHFIHSSMPSNANYKNYLIFVVDVVGCCIHIHFVLINCVFYLSHSFGWNSFMDMNRITQRHTHTRRPYKTLCTNNSFGRVHYLSGLAANIHIYAMQWL